MTKRVTRHPKGLKSKSRTHKVTEVTEGVFEVVSGSSGKAYTVCTGAHGQGAACSCDWGSYRKHGQASACSHTLAVYAWLAEREGHTVSAWATERDARRQHRHMAWDLASDGMLLTERH